jgi:hypothetical protein
MSNVLDVHYQMDLRMAVLTPVSTSTKTAVLPQTRDDLVARNQLAALRDEQDEKIYWLSLEPDPAAVAPPREDARTRQDPRGQPQSSDSRGRPRGVCDDISRANITPK